MSSEITTPDTTEYAIEATGLSKCYQIYDKPSDRLKQMLFMGKRRYYKEFWALKDVSFKIKKGETVGIIGRNGSGKSTLLQMICSTLSSTSGTLKINSRISALLELGSGFNPEFSGRENVYLNGVIHGLTISEIDARYDDIAAFADIGEFIDQPVKTYSSGMYARLAFASAIFVDPEILVIDEILAVGDAPFQAKCVQAFHRLRDRGCTILLVSHDAYMIRNFCQKALYLRKGEFIGFGDSSEIIDAYNIEIESAMTNKTVQLTNAKTSIDASECHPENPMLFQIIDVALLDQHGRPTEIIAAGSEMAIRFTYRTLSLQPLPVTFVFSLYRHDGLYICGATTLMDDISPILPGSGGVITINFPRVRLLAGQYIWRVAIDDERAFSILAEANRVCPFKVVDELESVGLFNLERNWSIDISKE